MVLFYIKGFFKYILSIFGFISLYIFCLFTTLKFIVDTKLEKYLTEENLIIFGQIFSMLLAYLIINWVFSFFRKLKTEKF